MWEVFAEIQTSWKGHVEDSEEVLGGRIWEPGGKEANVRVNTSGINEAKEDFKKSRKMIVNIIKLNYFLF